jgi:hypothetical protein
MRDLRPTWFAAVIVLLATGLVLLGRWSYALLVRNDL